MISDHNNKRFGILQTLISAPFIYVVFIPIVLVDIFISLYQWICFPLYEIPRVKRSQYVQHRRVHMPSLNWFDRLNCHYCSYANGVIRYAQKIASETERVWCPIRHKAMGKFVEPQHHKNFVIRAKKVDLENYYDQYEAEMSQPPAETEAASAKEHL